MKVADDNTDKLKKTNDDMAELRTLACRTDEKINELTSIMKRQVDFGGGLLSNTPRSPVSSRDKDLVLRDETDL
jgi:hypothetical protein